MTATLTALDLIRVSTLIAAPVTALALGILLYVLALLCPGIRL